MNNNEKDTMNEEIADFIMPEDKVYETCGGCGCPFYSFINFNGYCEFHRRSVKGSDPACWTHNDYDYQE